QKEQARYLPSEVSLRSNYPNPFRKHTTIEYTLPEPGRVTVEVFDVLGRKVRVLVNDQRKAGPHRVTWNGQNGSGQGVASGVYLTRLTFKGETITQKMVLVK
ncbi:MAG TPA: T9SS type A sorting domain-containing protein, partial [Salinibacter sp.]|nr:T9SS type A sorting domain-containing protein [Salinibacter sp.]